MKQKIILSIILTAIVSIAFAQSYPLVKIHAYSRATLGGAKPGGIVEEGGSEVKTAAVEKLNYFFYAEYRSAFKFTITGIWIKGKSYGIKTEPVAATPVTINIVSPEGSESKVTLVPATANKILHFYPSGQPAITSKPTAWLKNLLESSELVIKYQWKGKSWYYAVKKINRLDPVAGS